MDKKSVHVDWCAVDWTDPEMKFVLAFKHEAGGLLLISRDGGKSFTEGNKGYGLGAWVFDADTAVVALAKSKEKPKGGIVRTTDGGKTFEPVAEYVPVSLPKLQGDAIFWLVEGALLKGTEKGAKWEKVSDVKDARYGPVFGKDAKHLFVLTAAGVIESADARRDVVEAARGAEGTEGREHADLARLRPEERRAVPDEDGHRLVQTAAGEVTQ